MFTSGNVSDVAISCFVQTYHWEEVGVDSVYNMFWLHPESCGSMVFGRRMFNLMVIVTNMVIVMLTKKYVFETETVISYDKVYNT